VLGFLGPNGAGKSTTMKMLTGFLEPDAGSARIAGIDVLESPKLAKRKLGYLPEGAPCYGDMTARAFLAFIAEIRGFDREEAKRRVAAAVDKTQLTSVLEQRIETLSKGFKRRVAIAQAILHDPQVLIMDEPTDGLDPNQKHDVREIIREMASAKTIIISTHILEEVDAICSRAIIIAAGKVVADGTPKDLEARSRTHQAVTLKMRMVPVAAQQMLVALPGVASVETIVGGIRVLPNPGEIIYSTVEGFVRDKAWPVDDIVFARGHLEDVFRDITRSAENARKPTLEGGRA
jgi:ABC-2 type transport system ATP-binding protein